jgi:hypothetical protein
MPPLIVLPPLQTDLTVRIIAVEQIITSTFLVVEHGAFQYRLKCVHAAPRQQAVATQPDTNPADDASSEPDLKRARTLAAAPSW